MSIPPSTFPRRIPEVARAALPFLLKTIESIIEADPARQDVLLFANTGFVLYANAFLQADAAIAEWDDYVLVPRS